MAEHKVPVLDVSLKIPPELLGGVGADAAKFLRGDQTWAVPSETSFQTLWDSKIQRGQIELIQVRYATMYFNQPFLLVPHIILTMREPANKVVTVIEVTATYWKLDMGNITSVVIDWLALAR